MTGTRTLTAELETAVDRFARRRAGTAPDIVLDDVEGLLWGAKDVPLTTGVWPLVEAIGQPWSSGSPLTWVETLPMVEGQTLEKAQLLGTTLKVTAAMPPATTRAVYADVSKQVAASPSALAGVIGLMESSLRTDVDRNVAAKLTSLSVGNANDLAAALAMIGGWPGPRLVVLAPAASSGMLDIMRLAEISGGALRVVFDPYLPQSFVVATLAVAVGVEGPLRLTADKPSHLGYDVSVSAFVAVAGTTGAVAQFGRSSTSSQLDEVFIGPDDPYIANPGAATELWYDEDAP